MARQAGDAKYILARKGPKLYMRDIFSVTVNSITTAKEQKLYLDGADAKLMERFVRGDASRNTEGSGLGLNIAKSLMEVQHGQLQLLVDGDLFKVTLVFPGIEEQR